MHLYLEIGWDKNPRKCGLKLILIEPRTIIPDSYEKSF